jgi:hypothetical protein
MRLPVDIGNLLAVAIRDAIWFRRNVAAFLKECSIPQPFLDQALKMIEEKQATIKVVQFLLEKLDMVADKGEMPQRVMLTKMVRWKDFHSLLPDQQRRAKESIKALADAYQEYEAERKYQQERQEERMNAERQARGQMKSLDHNVLYGFRDEFDGICILVDPNERGNKFQDLMNRVFGYYSEQSRGAFRRDGEQIDGLFYFDKHWWYVEVRWKKEKAKAADISVLRDRAKDAFGGDTKALFISFNGYSEECFASLANHSDERVVLMDGTDLRDVLACDIAFDVLLAEKQADIVQNKRPFIGAREIIQRRLAASS